MDKHLKAILDNYDDAVKSGTGKPCVCIHGEHGSGKTALLEKLKDTLLKNGANVYFSIGMEGDGAIHELLRQLIRLYGNKYDKNFIEFITSYIQGTLPDKLSPEASFDFTKDSIVKFIFDCVKTEPMIFIIDNLDKVDSFTVNLLSNLLMIETGFFLIISLSDQVDSIILSDMLFRNAERIMYSKLTTVESAKVPASEESDIQIDEVMLVLTKPGREQQLIKHHLKAAEHCLTQLSFEGAIDNLNCALNVCRSINDKELELDILISLGETRFMCKEFTDAIDCYLKVLQFHIIQDMPEKRISLFIKLSECYDLISKHDIAREFIMMSEAFFALPDNRLKHYDLYSKHIVRYLFILVELGEEVIFKEKIKQAYDVCRADDEHFICALNSEEGYMMMHNGNYTAAHEKLTLSQNAAVKLNLSKMWDETTNSLAICNEHMGKPNISLRLWKEIIKKSHDPVRWAGAIVNTAIMTYEQDSDSEKAISNIILGVELCILAGENKIAHDISNSLKDTPLAAEALTRLSKYRLQRSI